MTDISDQPTEEGGELVHVSVVNFGQAYEVEVPEGSTVRDALHAAGVDADATIRFRGETVDGEQTEVLAVLNGETIVAAPPAVNHG